MLAMSFAGVKARERADRTTELLDALDMATRRIADPISCPAASSSAWRSPWRSRTSRR